MKLTLETLESIINQAHERLKQQAEYNNRTPGGYTGNGILLDSPIIISLCDMAKESLEKDASWKMLHDSNELCINNQYAEIKVLTAKIEAKDEEIAELKEFNSKAVDELYLSAKILDPRDKTIKKQIADLTTKLHRAELGIQFEKENVMRKDACLVERNKSIDELAAKLEIAREALERIKSGMDDKGPRVLADGALSKITKPSGSEEV
jgi:hypothetical protein